MLLDTGTLPTTEHEKQTQNKTKGNEVQKKVQGHRCEVRKAQRQANLTRACLFEAAVTSKRNEKF